MGKLKLARTEQEIPTQLAGYCGFRGGYEGCWWKTVTKPPVWLKYRYARQDVPACATAALRAWVRPTPFS